MIIRDGKKQKKSKINKGELLLNETEKKIEAGRGTNLVLFECDLDPDLPRHDLASHWLEPGKKTRMRFRR